MDFSDPFHLSINLSQMPYNCLEEMKMESNGRHMAP